MPSEEGPKEHNKGKKKTRKTHTEVRSTTDFSEIVPSMTPAAPPDEYQVVFLQSTKVLTCYGCGSKVIVVIN